MSGRGVTLVIEFEIDGKKIQAEDGATIIEAADNANIYIPRYCYHKKLSIAANCRMCLVEVEKVGKPLPACATPVTPDMKVFTQSPKAVEAQRSVMEFLLINHPLDCPICDQGGECELQDLAMGFGRPYSYFEEGKRSVYDDDLGPLIATNMTRCIQCTRCVRFGEEIAGMRELGVVARGEQERITTYVKHFMQSELSGNIIDLCPVGALTAKPSRYTFRSWELREHATVAPHDSVGSNIYLHSRGQEYSPARIVMRAVPQQNEAINETWISDRDRFSYEGLNHKDRLMKPRIKEDGQWQEVEWETALTATAHRLQAIIDISGADQLAALVSPSATLEEMYLLQKLWRDLGSNHIDHRLHMHDFSDQNDMPEFPNMGLSIADLENCDAVLLVGSYVRYEQPLISQRINKAAQEGAQIMVINPMDYTFNYSIAHKMIQANLVAALAQVAKALADAKNKSYDSLASIIPSEVAKHIAKTLMAANQGVIFIGAFAINHPDGAQMRALIRLIGELSGVQIGALTEGANASGAWLAGVLPHRGPANLPINPGHHAKSLLTDKPAKGYLLFGIEPEFDCAYSASALAVLKAANLVVCLSPFVSEAMAEYADVILPIAPFSETQGTFVNNEGTWQSFAPVSEPLAEARPGWKVLRVLANFLHLTGYHYETIHQVREELEATLKTMPTYQSKPIQLPSLSLNPPKHLVRLADWPMYCTDNIVRRATALQKTMGDRLAVITVNSSLAQQLGIAAGDRIRARQATSSITLPLAVDDRLADGVVLLPSALLQTKGFGESMAAITLEREDV